LEKVVAEKQETSERGISWFLVDANHAALSLSARFSSPWELFSLSGGHPLTIFGLWDGFSLLPMAAWQGGRFVRL